MELESYIEDYTQTKIPSPYGPLDVNGVPLFDLKFARSRIARINDDIIYHPVVIIQYGLAHHALWQRGDIDAKQPFLVCAEWLEENATWEPGERFVAWYYPYSLLTPNVSAPWFSGMTQGQALSLLLRAYQYTGSAATLDVARHAANSFLYELNEGGVLSTTAGGNYFVEEYVSTPAIHVLNGCLFGLVGLYEYLAFTSYLQLQRILESCVLGVEEVLPYYDLGWWSRYSLGARWSIATSHYHHIHISLLKYLGERLNSDVFHRVALRWESYEQLFGNRLRRRVLSLLVRIWNRLLYTMKTSDLQYRRVTCFRSG